MKTLISKLSVSLVALALVVAPYVAVAQTALDLDIDIPSSDNPVVVDEAYSFNASVTGGDGAYDFVWNFGDGSAEALTVAGASGETVGVHTYTETGTYDLTVTVTDGTGAEDSLLLLVTVVDGETTVDPLTISNIRVTDITKDSAVIRWTTNAPSTSRVIYDTVSHPSIDGESEPNFGYANSTGTTDEDPMVTEHAVTVSELSADTQYYFRVISTR